MEWIYRIGLALKTPLFGSVLLFLTFLFCSLLFFYLLLWLKQKADTHLVFRLEKYFSRAEDLLAPFKLSGTHSWHLLGKKALVEASATQYGIAVIPLPNLVDDKMTLKFCDFQERISQSHFSLFANMGYQVQGNCMVSVQRKLVRESGRLLQNLWDFRLDRVLTLSENEKLLLELAKNLNHLHTLISEEGKPLYHGFLLPNSLYLQEDASKCISHFVLAYHGFIYAIDPFKLFKRMTQIKKHKLPTLELAHRQEWLLQLNFLAPEQRDSKQLHLVGPASDFYAFGCLVSWLFNQKSKRFPPLDDLSHIPQIWRKFAQKCLAKDPKNRPQDFLEIIETFEDPEFSLSQYEIMDQEIPEKFTQDKANLKQLFNKLQKASVQAVNLPIDQSEKQSYLNKVIQDPNNVDALIKLAIIYYNKGERKQAEIYCEKAKAIDPNSIKSFQKYVSMRL